MSLKYRLAHKQLVNGGEGRPPKHGNGVMPQQVNIMHPNFFSQSKRKSQKLETF